jgi:hypothetical protein
MGFEMSTWDRKLLKYGELFEDRIMDLSVNIPLFDALDRCWAILAECFEPNLFEKIMIPRDREAIRRIRIKLGDEMAAAVGRAKIAKGKLAKVLEDSPQGAEPRETSV